MHRIKGLTALTSTLFPHDGVAIHFKDKTKITMWKRRLNALVTNAAKEFNAITHLEWE